MLNNDNIMTANASKIVQKVPTDVQMCRCPYVQIASTDIYILPKIVSKIGQAFNTTH